MGTYRDPTKKECNYIISMHGQGNSIANTLTALKALPSYQSDPFDPRAVEQIYMFLDRIAQQLFAEKMKTMKIKAATASVKAFCKAADSSFSRKPKKQHRKRLPIKKFATKPARNLPCPCGSQIKYKKCCGTKK